MECIGEQPDICDQPGKAADVLFYRVEGNADRDTDAAGMDRVHI